MTTLRDLRSSPAPLFPSHEARPPPSRREEPPAGNEPSPFARLLRGLSHEADAGETAVRGAVHASRGGASLDGASLLALQAGIYRYGETIDLAAQLVEKASTAVKTVVQGQ